MKTESKHNPLQTPHPLLHPCLVLLWLVCVCCVLSGSAAGQEQARGGQGDEAGIITVTEKLSVTHVMQRVVVTFRTWEMAAAGYQLENFTVIKQYGRRLVLDLGREVEWPDDAEYLKALLGVDRVENVEVDELVEVSQNWDWDINGLMVAAQDMSTQTTTPEGGEATTTPTSIPPYNLSTASRLWNYSDTPASFYTPPSRVPHNFSTSSPLWNLVDSEPYSIQVEQMWHTTNSTSDVVVAVLDTGLAGGADSLFLNLLEGYDFISDPKISLDGDGRDGNSEDLGDSGPGCPTPSWHGTKVAAVLAVRHDNAIGIKGVAPNCSVLPIRILGQCSQGYANDVTDAIVWAAGGKINGVATNPTPASIISMSFAGTGKCPTYLQSAISQAAALGAKLFAAAGNQGLPSINNTFPANCINVTSVGASTRMGAVAAYSNRGFTLAAPGGDAINPVLTASVDSAGDLVQTVMTGTSIAVSHVVGLYALITKRKNIVIFVLDVDWGLQGGLI